MDKRSRRDLMQRPEGLIRRFQLRHAVWDERNRGPLVPS